MTVWIVSDVIKVWVCYWWWKRVSSETCRAVCINQLNILEKSFRPYRLNNSSQLNTFLAKSVRLVSDVIKIWVCSWWWMKVSSETCRAVCRKYNKTVYSRILLDNYWHWFTTHGPMNTKVLSISQRYCTGFRSAWMGCGVVGLVSPMFKRNVT